MRLSSELDHADLRRDPSEIPAPYWQQHAQRLSLQQFLDTAGAAAAETSYNAAVSQSISFVPDSQRPPPPTPVPDEASLRLRWILRHTMGSPRAFALRKSELQALQGGDATNSALVSDATVLESFRGSVAPGGLMAEYLQHAQLALVLGNTLFVHGAVCERSAGHVPGHTSSCESRDLSSTSGVLSPRVWAERLNTWKEEQLGEWLAYPYYNSERSWRGGEALMDYAVPGGAQGRGVVYNHWLRNGSKGTPTPSILSPALQQWLLGDGIRRVVSGHWPHGDSPLFIKSPCNNGEPFAESGVHEDGVLVVAADTSYSDRDFADNRGSAAAAVWLEGSCIESLDRTCVNGSTSAQSGGHSYSFCVEEEELVGHGYTRQSSGIGQIVIVCVVGDLLLLCIRRWVHFLLLNLLLGCHAAVVAFGSKGRG